MYRKVLLAYDGSQSGRTALLECCDINNLLHAEIHLLAVAPLMAGLYLTEGFVPETLQDEENRRFKDILDEGLKLLSERGVKAQGHLITGEPVDEICRLAGDLGVDLIVVGHRRHAFFMSRWWKGSVGASLIEDAPCSVLIAIEK
ncbi:MAG: universal stress protein [Rhodocyclaceae bacterium]|jgi:nucleotide-binding universal stress UspA family protein|nr:universal stress protein [Rhodocyclaceae bacterium]